MGKRIRLPAYAKLNLSLDILHRRPDGYHELRTVMQTVSLHDTVTVTLTETPDISCYCNWAGIPTGESNLAGKAAKCFLLAFPEYQGGVQIAIQKRIPVGAGMAGGSSDAAAVLHALHRLLSPAVSQEQLFTLGAEIGSDVPYCMLGGCVLAEGRGERLTPLSSPPDAFIVLCKPDFSISSSELFSLVDTETLHHHPNTEAMLAAIQRRDDVAFYASVGNVLEEVLPEEYKEICTIREKMRTLGANATAMTGSGSTVFGLFAVPESAEKAYSILREQYEEVFLVNWV